jgi:hypothetical protein
MLGSKRPKSRKEAALRDRSAAIRDASQYDRRIDRVPGRLICDLQQAWERREVAGSTCDFSDEGRLAAKVIKMEDALVELPRVNVGQQSPLMRLPSIIPSLQSLTAVE